jgi:alkanesulfonate monooxygenase SsuD/methylene tetrahydromethanopterin reductase-like flavin-dependent oxidoreductase (luciferase family)
VKVGLVLPQAVGDGGATWPQIAARARQAEDGGIDSLWVYDHFLYRAEDVEDGPHEAWTLLSAVAATTQRVELGTLVLATSFRSPGLLAKMAATAQEVAGGRLILGLGCGWHEPEYRAFGYPFDHRVARFEEALAVILPLLRGERVTFEGRWTTVEDAVLVPAPTRPAPPLLVAAKGERMLRLTARHAAMWQTAWFGRPDDRWAQRLGDLRSACEAEGRDASTLGLTVGVDVGSVGDDGSIAPHSLPVDAAAIADALHAWTAEGVDHVQVGLATGTEETFDVVLDALRRIRG